MKSERLIPFAVGRITRDGSHIIFLQPPPPLSIRRPWVLRAAAA